MSAGEEMMEAMGLRYRIARRGRLFHFVRAGFENTAICGARPKHWSGAGRVVAPHRGEENCRLCPKCLEVRAGL